MEAPRRGQSDLRRHLIPVLGLGVFVFIGIYFVLTHELGRANTRPAAASATASTPRTRQISGPVATLKAASTARASRARVRQEMHFTRVALGPAVSQAHLLGGSVQVAIWVEGWPRPIALGDDLSKPMRMWSMAKPVEAIASMSSAAHDAVQLSAGFAVAMQRALQRSENCSARRMVLELQRLSGGTHGARAAFGAVLRKAGAYPIVATQEDGPAEQSADCEAFLTRHQSGLRVADSEAVLFGTSLWTVTDAVRFAHALADGTYGTAGTAVLAQMTERKEPSEEPGATLTADPQWGAGLAFHGYPVAYKAGWGGSRQGTFLAGQFAVVTVRGSRVAVAAMFHPRSQPQIDDPGETQAPLALNEIFTTVASTFPQLAKNRP
jgi:hypothetical protein